MGLPGAYREAIAYGVRSTVLRPVLALQQGTVEREARFNDPDRLRAERDSLAAFLVGNATLAAENRQLRTLLGLRGKLPPSFVPAEVIHLPERAAEGFFQLTVGTDQGVRAGAAIVAPEGLVGRVRNADQSIAFGIHWVHSDFRAAAMTVDGSVYGIVEPRRNLGGEPLLALTGTPRHVKLETGTLIVTSGHGGVYPRGIPIGMVVGPEGRETSWQRNYLVRPLVSPSEMTYVLVLGAGEKEISVDDLAQAWGIRPVEASQVDSAAAAAATAAAEAAARPQTTQPATRREPSGPRLLGVPVQPQRTPAGDTGRTGPAEAR